MANWQTHIVYFEATGTTNANDGVWITAVEDATAGQAYITDTTNIANATTFYGPGALRHTTSPVDIPNGTFPGRSWYVGGKLITTRSDQARSAILRKKSVEFSRAKTDLMNFNWIITPNGTASTVSPLWRRWRNTRGWILSPMAIIDALLDNSNIDSAEKCFEIYEAIIPTQEDRIRYWYFNHSETVWSDYFGWNGNDPVPAHMNWDMSMSTVPEFGSDLSSATEWDGVDATKTLAIRFAGNMNPEDYSS